MEEKLAARERRGGRGEKRGEEGERGVEEGGGEEEAGGGEEAVEEDGAKDLHDEVEEEVLLRDQDHFVGFLICIILQYNLLPK